MKLEEIIEAWTTDAKIDETDLSRESLTTTSLHAKYLRMFSDERLKLRSYRIKHKSLYQSLSDYYKGDLNNPEDLAQIKRDPWPKKILKQELHSYIDADQEMVDLNVRIAYQEELVDVLQEIIKAINSRNFSITNSINFLRFINGNN
jgi:hypothetical protein